MLLEVCTSEYSTDKVKSQLKQGAYISSLMEFADFSRISDLFPDTCIWTIFVWNECVLTKTHVQKLSMIKHQNKCVLAVILLEQPFKGPETMY